jgi:aspartate carbamoyltransferase regulatory subunit
MSSCTTTLSVAAIKEGNVIDHIPVGQALPIIRFLKLQTIEARLLIGINLFSPSMGSKDLIKIENGFLTEAQQEGIAIFAPSATIITIQDYQVTRKVKAHLPEAIIGIFSCPNPQCITHTETLPSHFHVEKGKDKALLCCHFCEKIFSRDRFESS